MILFKLSKEWENGMMKLRPRLLSQTFNLDTIPDIRAKYHTDILFGCHVSLCRALNAFISTAFVVTTHTHARARTQSALRQILCK